MDTHSARMMHLLAPDRPSGIISMPAAHPGHQGTTRRGICQLQPAPLAHETLRVHLVESQPLNLLRCLLVLTRANINCRAAELFNLVQPLHVIPSAQPESCYTTSCYPTSDIASCGSLLIVVLVAVLRAWPQSKAGNRKKQNSKTQRHAGQSRLSSETLAAWKLRVTVFKQ